MPIKLTPNHLVFDSNTSDITNTDPYASSRIAGYIFMALGVIVMITLAIISVKTMVPLYIKIPAIALFVSGVIVALKALKLEDNDHEHKSLQLVSWVKEEADIELSKKSASQLLRLKIAFLDSGVNAKIKQDEDGHFYLYSLPENYNDEKGLNK
jgi:hypothetical protein